MTLRKLHNQIGKLIAEGHGRCGVCIEKTTFNHALESDGCVILSVEAAEIKTHNMIDDDGGTKVRKDGREVYRTSLVLYGEKPSKFGDSTL